MLIAKIYINEKQIDEIHIHNKGLTRSTDKAYELFNKEYCNYKVLRPIELEEPIIHDRAKGYIHLLIKALQRLA